MSNAMITPDDKERINAKIFRDRVKELHEHLLTTTIPALLLCSTVVFFALYRTEDRVLITSWYIASVLLSAVRFGEFEWYKHDASQPRRHLKLFIVITALSGLIWGMAGTLLTPPQHILHKIFVIIIIAGLNAGGCQTLRASKTANALFILFSISPLTIWLLAQQQSVYTYLSLAFFGYLMFMLFLAHKAYNQYVNALQLHYENEILLDKLVTKHDQLEKTNQQLNEEIVEHEKAKNQLKFMLKHDFLTGIDNRLSFDIQFDKLLVAAKAHNHEFCVLYIDIDHFKNINDNYGHDIGDLLLVAVSGRLKQNLREQDTLARMGGDEFIVLISNKHVKKTVDLFTQRIYKSFAKPFKLNEFSFTVSISVGSSFFPEDGDEKLVLLKKADIALYRAKLLGRNRYELYRE